MTESELYTFEWVHVPFDVWSERAMISTTWDVRLGV